LKYSQLKLIINKLHLNGWYKVKGFPEYRKIWGKGTLRYGQAINIRELMYENVPISMLLDYYERKATSELELHLAEQKSK
jgi:hypothetical protein